MGNPFIDKYGNKKWLGENSKYHRVDGPAIEYANGSKEWYLNGKLHRLDGPAKEWVGGEKYWYVNNRGLSEEQHAKLTGDIKDLPLYLGLGFDDLISERLNKRW